MESKLNVEIDQIIISLTNDECLSIADGAKVTDRYNPFDPSAKVEVVPLAALDPTYVPFDPSNPQRERLFDAFSKVACRAMILGNNDIRVFVPQELVRYNYFSSELILFNRIDGAEDIKPVGGIRINFSSRINE